MTFPQRIKARFTEKGKFRLWNLVKVTSTGVHYATDAETTNNARRTAFVTPSGWSYGVENGHIREIQP